MGKGQAIKLGVIVSNDGSTSAWRDLAGFNVVNKKLKQNQYVSFRHPWRDLAGFGGIQYDQQKVDVKSIG